MATSTEADPDDLYGDLADTKPAPIASKKLAQSKDPPTSNQMNKQVEDLAEENRILKRNIGTLYRTARAEIKRKDDEISRLILEIEKLKK